MKLFSTAFLQVFCVACSTYFLSHTHYTGAFASAFLISWLWSANIKKIAIGSTKDRLIYSAGAATGSTLGLYVSATILKFL